ncbi:unnamed protein product [Caenorhabditis auriculariae]|uniref:Uncharacterized protein n=1 Tax=Caenorhabditis auriculariae TaxID=2777116 RepID=A0A8S1GN59_9PELO|nr:unnamed protein product [Caenorhabditis auriculariae]
MEVLQKFENRCEKVLWKFREIKAALRSSDVLEEREIINNRLHKVASGLQSELFPRMATYRTRAAQVGGAGGRVYPRLHTTGNFATLYHGTFELWTFEDRVFSKKSFLS